MQDAAQQPTLRDDEIIGLDHPLMTPELASAILGGGGESEVTVKASVLNRASMVICALADPSGEGERTLAAGAPKSVVRDIQAAFDAALRAAQQRLLKETGAARPQVPTKTA